MAKTLSNTQQRTIKEVIYRRADEFGYMNSGRIESGRFLDELVEDPEVGGVLKEYMPKERVRTYIKDGVLNAYTKAKNKTALSAVTPIDTVKRLLNYEAVIIQKCPGKHDSVFVLRAVDGKIIVVSRGTAIKWETALRKALEIIANEPGLSVNGSPVICLQLSEASQALTDADREHIRTALGAIGVKALFCSTSI